MPDQPLPQDLAQAAGAEKKEDTASVRYAFPLTLEPLEVLTEVRDVPSNERRIDLDGPTLAKAREQAVVVKAGGSRRRAREVARRI